MSRLSSSAAKATSPLMSSWSPSDIPGPKANVSFADGGGLRSIGGGVGAGGVTTLTLQAIRMEPVGCEEHLLKFGNVNDGFMTLR